MNDELIQRLVRMSAEAEGLERDNSAAADRPGGCIGMSKMQATADAGVGLSAIDVLHVKSCAICGPRWQAMLASRPAAVSHATPSRWYRIATAMTAAAACVGAVFTVLPRPSGQSPIVAVPGSVQPIVALNPPITVRAGLLVCIPGDSNCDGVVDSADLSALGFAVHRPEEYADRFPNCDAVCSNDVNGDAVVDQCDVDELVQCVGG